MSVRVHRSERSRHLVLRVTAGESLPSALVAGLRQERVTSGWLRASGVLADVELSAFDSALGRLGEPRRIAGLVHVLSLESSIGLVGGAPAFSLRAVLARESDRGLETIAGEIASARTIALEALVTVFEDLALDRSLDPVAGVSLVDSPSTPAATVPAVPAVPRAPAAATPRASPAASATTWSAAASASAQSDRGAPGGARSATSQAVPVPVPRPVRADVDVDQPTPEPGDFVDHFAFGRCEVIKSDGDRLHLRIPKDGRVREIALEMLRVTPLDGVEGEGPGRRFKLERRI